MIVISLKRASRTVEFTEFWNTLSVIMGSRVFESVSVSVLLIISVFYVV